ncbi:glycosyltransferase family 2 protein [bacterium]|nr:glycosyltransferase family 2 protein [bacterium]
MGSYSEEKFFLRNILNKIAVKEAIVSPKISIIVVTLNSEKNIANCLFSLAEQTLKEIEVIVIDRGSTDDTLNLLAVFEQVDARFKVIRQNKLDIFEAKNKGIEIARGDYISFVDTESFVKENTFKKLYSTAIKTNHSKIGTFVLSKKNKLKYKIQYVKISKYKQKGT